MDVSDRMISGGVARAKRTIETAQERGTLGQTPTAQSLIRKYVQPVSDALATYFLESSVGRGRQPVLYRQCGHMDPRVVAYIGLTTAFSMFESGVGQVFITEAARQIGRALEHELMVEAVKAYDKQKWGIVDKAIKRRGLGITTSYRQWRANILENKIPFQWMTPKEILHLGLPVLDTILLHTPLFVVEIETVVDTGKKRGRKAPSRYVKLAPQVIDWMFERAEMIGLLRPVFLPSLEKPVDWAAQKGGGYPVDQLSKLPLVKELPFKCGLREGEAQMSQDDLRPIFKSVNALQSTPWTINQPVLQIMQHAWDQGLEIGLLPPKYGWEIPPFPENGSPEEKEEWRKRARFLHTENRRTSTERLGIQRLLTTTQEFVGAEALYFPQVLDFRSRAYPMSSLISPHGADHQRSLLQFAVEGPATDDALYWSAIHGANCYGVDKVPFSDRLQWTLSNNERIHATADDPFRDLWWTEADSPWCFLAWCIEWSRSSGFHLPVAMDGSCNGLQHLSALLRDPVGAKHTNLLASDVPADIYTAVAGVARRRLIEAADNDGNWTASAWVAFGIDRKMTKRQVMVMPYGGTFISCLEYTREAVREKIAGGIENPFGDKLAEACAYLAGIIWEAIEEVVVAAMEVMGWLRDVARMTAKANIPLIWTTPAGFVVQQSYQNVKRRQVRSLSYGKFTWLDYYDRTETIDSGKQANSFPPNYIHSMDAAAMHLTIGRSLDAGITDFVTIHDSFGTHPHNTRAFRKIINDTFADIYTEQDWLHNLYKEISRRSGLDIPPPPARRDFDVNNVRSSPYFFA